MTHLPYQRLQVDLAALIAKSHAGARLPSEPNLAKQLGVSRATLREAMRMFESQGLIRRRQGAGTFVLGKEPAVESGLEVLESLDTMAQRMGIKISVGNILVSRVHADENMAVVLDVPVRRPLIQISRVIRSDTGPIAYLVDTLSEEILRPEELNNNFSGSMFDFLVRRGDPLTVSRDEINAVRASADLARVLEIQRGDTLLQFSSKLYTSAAKVIDYSFNYFLPGYFKFHIVRRMGNV
ncbi:MAG: GntR family transcriptional regulator [Anaerolineales bacterium]